MQFVDFRNKLPITAPGPEVVYGVLASLGSKGPVGGWVMYVYGA